LHYYDDPSVPPNPSDAGLRVQSVRDWGAFLPLGAHTQYWTSGTLGQKLHAVITE
jgi:hypothetical protein